jgi:hypothetical protein
MQSMVGWVLMGLVVAAGSVRPAQAQATTPAAQQQPSANTLSPAERAAGWRLLFDGTSTKGWRGFRQKTAPDGWQVVDGTLSRVRSGADLVTVDQFDSFELALEWKIAPGGNSGIMFRVSEDEEATYHTGPEMQVLDNGRHPDGKAPLTSAGSCYGLYAPVKDTTKPVGEWNAVRLIVNGNHVEHWLNDVKVVEYELGSPEWTKLVRSSKFNEWPRYGRVPRGHIALQDHGDLVSYRNIKIRSIGSR